MRQITWAMCTLAVAVAAGSGAVFAETPANLLNLARADTAIMGFIEGGEAEVARLIDGDPETTAVFHSADGGPVDILFAFEGGTVAPESFTITLSGDGDARPPARMDLLASTASASAGFASLRTERIDPMKPTQQARFASAAANWLLHPLPRPAAAPRRG